MSFASDKRSSAAYLKDLNLDSGRHLDHDDVIPSHKYDVSRSILRAHRKKLSQMSRLESARLLRTDYKENVGKREGFRGKSGTMADIKGTRQFTSAIKNDVCPPPMAPLIIFPSKHVSEECSQPVRPGDLELLENGLLAGGCLVTIHDPTEAISWLDANFKNPLLCSLRERGVAGPFPVMLSTSIQGLAIFGSLTKLSLTHDAEALAKLSNFAVIVRPESDHPIPKFARSKSPEEATGSIKIASLSNGTGNNQESRSLGSGGEIGNGSGSGDTGDGGDSGAGGGDPRNEGCDEKGESGRDEDSGKRKSAANNNEKAACKLKVSSTSTYNFRVKSTFRFAAPIPDDTLLDRNAIFESLNETDIEAYTKLEVDTDRQQLLVDATYASLGFEGHRRRSLHSCKYIAGGNEPPKQIYTQANEDRTHTLKGVVAGYTGFMPKAEGTFNHGKTHTNGLQATAATTAPDWIVRQKLGDRFNEDKKSYLSIATSYEPHSKPFDTILEPLDVNVGLGLVLADSDEPQEIPISFVNRNQIHLWVSDPNSKTPARGVIFLVSNYLPNIRTEHRLMITEDEIPIDISTPVLPSSSSSESAISIETKPNHNNETHSAKNPEIFDVSIAPVQKSLNNGKLRKSPPPSRAITPIQLQPCVTRGWNITTKCWLAPVWPDLDEGFKAVEAFRPAIDNPQRRRCWKLIR
ncbi:hypothetical protein C8R43DRAFT_1234499 [Mycena crocata]|nr:hypothetical protein C8R43DRAFT_1234499 [Mycena crocata]